MPDSPATRLVRGAASAALALSLVAGPPAMTLHHAFGAGMGAAGMVMGHEGHSEHPGGHSPQDAGAPCCDLCVVGCVSALALDVPGTVLSALAPRIPVPAPLVVVPRGSLFVGHLPPSIGPPSRI